MKSEPVDRRAFLARVGVLGAVAAANVALPGVARAAVTKGLPTPVLDLVKQLLAEIARDTLNGLAVFVVPGPDAYSGAQGTPSSTPGAMEAQTTDFLIESLDNYVPAPDTLVKPIAAALANGLADVPVVLPGDLLGLPSGLIDQLDDAVRLLLRNDETLPLSLVIALLLNNAAVEVNPAAVRGLFLSPFSRLSFEEKGRAFEQLEMPTAQMVAAVDAQLPEPLKGTVSGMLQFISGALLEFSAFGTFSEWATYDPATKFVTKQPVGWRLSGYDPGVMDGWDDFRGYYQGREQVSSK